MQNKTVKKERDLFKQDLSNKVGSYTKELQDNMELINSLGNNPQINLNAYVQNILKIIEKAHDTEAKRKFIMTLQKQRNKFEAMMYVMNAYLKGCGLEAI